MHVCKTHLIQVVCAQIRRETNKKEKENNMGEEMD